MIGRPDMLNRLAGIAVCFFDFGQFLADMVDHACAALAGSEGGAAESDLAFQVLFKVKHEAVLHVWGRAPGAGEECAGGSAAP